MRFVCGIKSIPKMISHLGGVPRRSLDNTFGNFVTTGTISIGGLLESKSLILTIWYKHTFEIILQALRQDIIQSLGIEFPLPL